jgi:hypothetical protein
MLKTQNLKSKELAGQNLKSNLKRDLKRDGLGAQKIFKKG